MKPELFQVNVLVKEDKVQSVEKILSTHYGQKWRINHDFEF